MWGDKLPEEEVEGKIALVAEACRDAAGEGRIVVGRSTALDVVTTGTPPAAPDAGPTCAIALDIFKRGEGRFARLDVYFIIGHALAFWLFDEWTGMRGHYYYDADAGNVFTRQLIDAIDAKLEGGIAGLFVPRLNELIIALDALYPRAGVRNFDEVKRGRLGAEAWMKTSVAGAQAKVWYDEGEAVGARPGLWLGINDALKTEWESNEIPRLFRWTSDDASFDRNKVEFGREPFRDAGLTNQTDSLQSGSLYMTRTIEGHQLQRVNFKSDWVNPFYQEDFDWNTELRKRADIRAKTIHHFGFT